MKETISKKTGREYTFMKVVCIVVITLLFLVSSAGATPYAYITNSKDNTVSVIDTTTNDVIATVPVDQDPCGVVINPEGTRVYVTSETDSWNDIVSVIDTNKNKVIATVTVGKEPSGVAVSPEGKYVYVANYGSDTISIIDAASNIVKATLPAIDSPYGIVVNPSGTKLYVTNFLENTVSVIDIDTNNVIKIPVGANPKGVAINPAGTKVYVGNYACTAAGFSVSVIDTRTNNVTDTINIGDSANGIAVSPSGKSVYVTTIGGRVSVIDTATNNVTAKVPVGDWPIGVSLTPDGKYAYVANWGSGNVSVINTATNKVTDTVTVGRGASAFGQFIISPKLKADFSWIMFIGTGTSKVFFKDISTGYPISWSWGFGVTTSIFNPALKMQNPSYSYKAGTYTVTLTVKNAAGESSTVSKQVTVTTKPPIWRP